MAKTTENVARAAQRRAAVTAYLNQHPQAWLTAAELGTALDLSAKEASYTGQNLADNKLCKRAINADGRGIYASLDAGPPPEGATTAKANTPVKLVPKKAKREPRLDNFQMAAPKMSKTGDVELSLGGVLIIVGRNPASGRIRITLE